MSHESNIRFEMRKVTAIEWVILDLSLPENHPQRTMACVYEIDDLEYDVVWLRDFGLAEHYMSPAEVLDDLIRASHRSTRSAARPPIPIPHRPPRAERVPA
ncbi:hypothetical protein K0817_005815 [Microbacterium sp. HD4P20]|uniref:hypothetical protein n=1 Tax=Microbacterium sp. HD4P20 TaxID=2864874 RepID=UPI001C640BF2|nr:hypothetical protein [Microbacterium sp. HD4P20]MCP2636084.1 hypothetical protein [Microbacterium sp. HD4P20]